MDLSVSHRLTLPLLHAGQAQKEMFHNEALALLDCLVQPVVQSVAGDVPPAAPVVGECHIVGDDATGEWAGRECCLAGWTVGGWRFVTPFEGFHAWVAPVGVWAVYRGGAWAIGTTTANALEIGGVRVVGSRGAAVPLASSGAVVDAEARAALSMVIERMVAHGLIEESLL